ncbi:cytochrome C [Burkholderia territorii]|nr:cytochrome C [Burkholderia territorii]KWE29976.1 cytochrome C [Burkholderia territorii]KWE36977.1 cytochrome C [Burkholderia territorii]KWE44311.1 cytochrome C [Burkholderia territorii]
MRISRSIHAIFYPYLSVSMLFSAVASARAETPAALLAGYTAQAGTSAAPARGQQFFTSRHGREWSCASCHGSTPTGQGRHVVTGKAIEPLAPAFNPARFTDAARSEKWFRRNCKDVVGRECSAAEKADVLSWLMSLKP